MFYFNNQKNVEAYLKMAEGYDGRELIDKLDSYLTPESSVLELGMGPGTDLDILLRKYEATGSDISDVFIDLYRKKHQDVSLIKLDAVSINTEQRFDCIYSNKVLHHISKEELISSLKRQKDILKTGGLLLHSFWLGEGAEEFDGLFFQYYCEAEIIAIAGKYFDIIDSWVYDEMETDDSIALILKLPEMSL